MAIFTPIYSACKNAVHYKMGNHHKKKPETDANKWARKLTQWTAVVAIVGIATVIVLYRTDETARLRDRAFVYFTSFTFTPVIGPNGRATAWRITPFWLNSGNTPAKFVDVETWCPIETNPNPVYRYDKLIGNGNGRSIGPKQTIQGIICQITSTALSTERDGVKLFLTARASYRDVFDPEYERVTEYCAQITGLSGDLSDPNNRSTYLLTDSGPDCKLHNCSDDECKAKK